MRISNQMITRNYLKRMNNNLTNLTKSNEKMASQRAFNKGSENVSDAGKALRLRKRIEDNMRHATTIREAEGRAAAAEDGVRTVNGLLQALTDRTVEGLNGTMSREDREKIALELERAQEEILQIMNNQYSGKYLYGAAGNKEGTAPFEVVNGTLTYQGTNVNNMVKDPYNGTVSTIQNNLYVGIPYNEHNYVDIGYGYQIDADGKVDANTGYRDTYSGVEVFGYGMNDDGMPLNAYNLMGSIAANLRGNNIPDVEKGLDAIPDSMNFMLTSIVDIGARGVTLQHTDERLEGELINLLERQGQLEGVDLSNEIIFNKSHEMSWMVTLQLGSRMIPQTIFDFLR